MMQTVILVNENDEVTGNRGEDGSASERITAPGIQYFCL
jgi:hypothetical protein